MKIKHPAILDSVIRDLKTLLLEEEILEDLFDQLNISGKLLSRNSTSFSFIDVETMITYSYDPSKNELIKLDSN